MMANYLRGSFERHKKFMARLRMSGHNLQIELGRRDNTPSNERFCVHCDKHQIGDEYHLMNCTFVAPERAQYNIQYISRRDFITIMSDPPLQYKLFFRDALTKIWVEHILSYFVV